MKFYTFVHQKQILVGAELDGSLVKLPFSDMLELIRCGGAALSLARQTMERAKPKALVPLRKTKLLAPIPRPGKILCSGLNYRSHVEENPNAKFLEDPRFFAKLPNTVIGPGAPILHPGERFQVDYEVELAVVFGRRGNRLTQASAMRHVFGYTILHDVSARWIQFKDNNETMGKNFDTFCPMGPCLVTANEIPDPVKLRLQLRLNGETMQDRTNEDWCFPLPRMIEWLSMAMTLESGDVMSTGTPAGIGYFRNSKVFLKPGDVCDLEISGIGTLTNPVKSAPYQFRSPPTNRS
jgi:2-keto-4-pentenoate hydratase/2-oxohepta-3-ene-1,7-dioic acid hydratase in catechol pathway